MWANTCWGFVTLTVAFGLAGLTMIWTPGHEIWGPRLLYAATACGVPSLICFLWPLFKRRATIFQERPDMPISDVTNYMVNDSSVKLKAPKPSEVVEFSAVKGRLVNWPGIGHVDALQLVQTALNNGMLDAWGCRELTPNSNMPHFEPWQRPIPKEYWQSAYLNHSCFCVTDKEAQTTLLPAKNAEPRYTRLMMNKRQVKKLWTSNSWWHRLLSDLRFIRRRNLYGKEIDRNYRPIKSVPSSK